MSRDDVWIRDDPAFLRLLDGVGSGPVAIDLEADSFHSYQDKICLVQVSVGGVHRLVDPLAGVDLSLAEPVLADPGVTKIFHGADYDLRLLDRDHGLRVRGLFDTMIAARFTGRRRFGLAALLDEEFGIRLDKSHQRADWSRRPLTEAMVDYALEDTRHLAELAARLERRLAADGRTGWVGEEFRRLEEVRWTAPSRDEERYRRVKGAKGLDPRQWTVLRAVHAWREDRARERDVPPFRVASDAFLVALATAAPASLEDLGRVRGLPRPLRRGGAARELLRAVERGRSDPEVEPPAAGRRPPDAGVDEARLRRLRKARDAVAAKLGLEPSLVATRRVLEEIARRDEAGEDWADVDGLRDWQRPFLEDVVASVAADGDRL